MITLSRLYTYPVKSMRGLQLSHSLTGESGLMFDRNFMITTTDGIFMTARQYPQLVLFTPFMLNNGIYLRAPNGESATVLYSDFKEERHPTEVWNNHFTALVAPDEVNIWLSSFFDTPVQLRWLSEELTRRVKQFPDISLSFADGFPYLIINEASFHALQQRCPASIKIEQFRANIVVTGAAPFEEDSWQTIQIGNIIFDLPKPCSRCILTTISTEKGRKNPKSEPLATLQSFRTAKENGAVDFGQNAIARNSGIIRVGDNVTILEKKIPREYGNGEQAKDLNIQKAAEQAISIEFNGQRFTGNNQQIILEQLEKQGIKIPYSCRAGICGSCKISLIEGNVSPLKSTAIRDNGKILACSCIPQNDLVIELN
ncbi:putative 2Fe-2S protein with ferredoxin-like NADP-linked domain and 2Fe-2S ferredoxin-like domain [Xenorhabdus bovienii str. Jollieti]|uniref:Putative 2Fe-2S protein with ferredoxin-like NADP-linked domain and 2Fe-2S ferredoxin-like domain n=1 Tax=Xenorhabdus bovienii (strain SS-2004) TaxID=406818 RepID=D3UWU4_XENBS|nr:YcbX family protein [Xenorhabdus bovienii]CBJ79929.1 putative 2Fe-2S protein with ferredoxin-like NADP-linked domain and 2Fe-2S ferredoxin-like domain [Xenorhabdus bovienii SS-2004]CDH29631.1 putative 2Fe-2S protein with ferredoxin-like NADP-linked domain and 2Fe-2S ferredoxin-like domain [Xenorhabdus bovienii str. Jollieti]